MSAPPPAPVADVSLFTDAAEERFRDAFARNSPALQLPGEHFFYKSELDVWHAFLVADSEGDNEEVARIRATRPFGRLNRRFLGAFPVVPTIPDERMKEGLPVVLMVLPGIFVGDPIPVLLGWVLMLVTAHVETSCAAAVVYDFLMQTLIVIDRSTAVGGTADAIVDALKDDADQHTPDGVSFVGYFAGLFATRIESIRDFTDIKQDMVEVIFNYGLQIQTEAKALALSGCEAGPGPKSDKLAYTTLAVLWARPEVHDKWVTIEDLQTHSCSLAGVAVPSTFDRFITTINGFGTGLATLDLAGTIDTPSDFYTIETIAPGEDDTTLTPVVVTALLASAMRFAAEPGVFMPGRSIVREFQQTVSRVIYNTNSQYERPGYRVTLETHGCANFGCRRRNSTIVLMQDVNGVERWARECDTETYSCPLLLSMTAIPERFTLALLENAIAKMNKQLTASHIRDEYLRTKQTAVNKRHLDLVVACDLEVSAATAHLHQAELSHDDTPAEIALARAIAARNTANATIAQQITTETDKAVAFATKLAAMRTNQRKFKEVIVVRAEKRKRTEEFMEAQVKRLAVLQSDIEEAAFERALFQVDMPGDVQ